MGTGYGISRMQPSPQFTPPASSSSGQGAGVWIFVGCGLLLLLTLCAGSGGLIYYAMNQGAAAGFPAGPTGAPTPTGAPGDPAVPAPAGTPLPSRTVQATVTQAIGNSPAPVNATCNFVVTAVADAANPASVTCRAQVVCGGQLLYGGPQSGYFPCTVSDQPPRISGRDENTTSTDTDAAMTLDTTTGQLMVHDDAGGPHGAFSVTARIDSVL
jgi:hypothetical protein